MGSSSAAAARKPAQESPRVIWAPQPGSQELFLSCPFFEVLYDGTRGPGKTDALLMDFAQHVGVGFGPAWRGLLFRREYKNLADVVARSKKWFSQIFPGARFLESQSDYKWKFPDGEELLLRAVKKADDYWDYHGQEYPWIGWEELTSWPDLKLYLDMQSVCRSSHPGVPRKYRATTNPWGRGHNAVKRRFVDPAPSGQPISDGQGRHRVRIFGSIYENKILLQNDPGYLATLEAITDPNKRAAWLQGSWAITAGGLIDDIWTEHVHSLRPFVIPSSWRIDRAFDWGSSKPFSVGWWAESDGSPARLADGTERHFPPGTLFRIAEWYGCQVTPEGEPVENEGLKLPDKAIARGIKEREAALGIDGRVKPGPADSSIFDEVNGDSPAKQQAAEGVKWEKADKSPGSRVRGAQLIRNRLEASLQERMEEPGMFIFNTCRDWLRTVPVIGRSEKNPDDADTESEDHAWDESRYRVLANKTSSATSVEFRGFL